MSKQLKAKVVCKKCGLYQPYCLPQSLFISSSLMLGLQTIAGKWSCSVIPFWVIVSYLALSLKPLQKYIAQVPLLLFCSSLRQSLQMLSNETKPQKDVSSSICEAWLFQLRSGAWPFQCSVKCICMMLWNLKVASHSK